jgi:hypothetical protein
MPDSHLTDEQLALFEDGELAESAAAHLKSCAECGRRLREIESLMAAYMEYRGRALPPHSWASLDTLTQMQKTSRWWPRLVLAAAACAVLAALAYYRAADRPSARTNELLERSASLTLPEGRMIFVRTAGRTLTRPAVLMDATRDVDPESVHLRTLFVAASYSWRDPLSARSFRTWRSGLREKRDSVSVIRQKGTEDSYRVRTESPGGALRSVSLTLRAADLRPTDGTFAFDGEAPLEITETPSAATEAIQVKPPVASAPPTESLATESQATPEDTLHVLAALDAVGADVGDPIGISEDSAHRHVVVRGNGLTPERRQLITQALKPLPRVVLQFDSGAPDSVAAQSASPVERNSTDIPADFRRQLEDRFGGAVALQEVTDRVLESSASIVARAHALQTLATWFPPSVAGSMADRDRDLLRNLQQRHVAELRRVLTRMRGDLEPVLRGFAAPAPVASTDWQSAAPGLVLSAQNTDTLLNRLLAGSYTQSSGQDMLRGLPQELQRLEGSLRAEEQGMK